MRFFSLRRSICWALALAGLTACRDDLQPTGPAASASSVQASEMGQARGQGRDRSAEAHGPRVAQQVPDFGGWFFDDHGDLNVWVRNPDLHGARARAAVAQVAAEVGLIPARPDYRIIIRQGRYGWQELSDWRDRIEDAASTIEGVRWVDLDERTNRVSIGVNSGRARAQARKEAAEIGIPVSALSVQMVDYCTPDMLDCQPDPCTADPSSCEDTCTVDSSSCQDPCAIDPSSPGCTTDPCETNPDDAACQPPAGEVWSGGEIDASYSYMAPAQSLDSEFTRLRGGIRIRNYTRQGDNSCTIGAVAYSPSFGAVFVTNSHCTYDQGGVSSNNRDFYQHYISQPLWVGTEVQDPPYVQPSGCSWWSTSSSCYLRRNSDAAVIRIENRGSERGTIARPINRKLEGQGSGSLQVDASRPMLRIVRDQATTTITVAAGNRLDKIGASTGWTSGTVQAVCRTEYQTSPNKRQHTCQNTVNYTNDFGDSGAPVFYLENATTGTVWLLGLHHMKKGTYSPLTQVARDLPGLAYR